MTTLATTIGGKTFDNCMMNAAGVRCQNKKDLDALVQSNAGAYVTKSATPQERAGNPSPRMHTLLKASINSMGLPNNGLDYYLDYVIRDQQKRPDSTNFLSVAGTSLEDNLAMLHQIQDSEYTGFVELNLSCPNVPGKPQVGYDFDRVHAVLEHVFDFYTKPLGVKLPPYFDLVHFDQIAAILNQYPLTFVNSINSIGNALVVDPRSEQVVIRPKGGFGGIGGAIVKPTALANVRGLALRLKPEIKIIGTGGIINGVDVFEHILCGASMVQIGTQFGYEGPALFDRLAKELTEIMAEKGYSSIEDFRGKLKTFDD
ncbi:dihydroorotate oxidase [Secundilactobacillus mixtipabuli]|uniref:dihydroorotate oxidase (fumarate) n=1 Tax=Secundilactobacillus mixtipabuli TaxID=1435342 RepID=A0A1Z5IBU0_9LACO|nr:dihydroorotate oxidase [Secundilactobacillus mixtipabuli]GAW99296.1 dihydroorotate dehydrogenase [Secundilactobacillus mixtipabuli]